MGVLYRYAMEVPNSDDGGEEKDGVNMKREEGEMNTELGADISELLEE